MTAFRRLTRIANDFNSCHMNDSHRGVDAFLALKLIFVCSVSSAICQVCFSLCLHTANLKFAKLKYFAQANLLSSPSLFLLVKLCLHTAPPRCETKSHLETLSLPSTLYLGDTKTTLSQIIVLVGSAVPTTKKSPIHHIC